MISYAQNLEDVVLWRALKHVRAGFYIDVGANDPSIDSVTRAFYEAAWSGINIEPLASHHADLEACRPRDINLCCAAGEEAGEVTLWEYERRGWASMEPAVLERHAEAGYQATPRQVPMRTLADICAEHAPGEIHFLKVDVEGAERAVLCGADFARYRPWIVVVEATWPASSEESHHAWEGLLLSSAYRLAYADGLNRFYLALEHSELMESLTYPPNFLDGFSRAAEVSLSIRVRQLEAELAQSAAQLREASEKSLQLQHELERSIQARGQLARWWTLQLQRLREHGLGHRSAGFFRKAWHRLTQGVGTRRPASAGAAGSRPTETALLTPRERELYQLLKAGARARKEAP